jgi:hypothetical protein
LIALFAEYFAQIYAVTSDWAERAESDIAQWPATAGAALSPNTSARLQMIVDEARRRGLLDSHGQLPVRAPREPRTS